MCFKAADDASIERLNQSSEVWFEVEEFYICWFVGDVMAGKIVKMEANISLLHSHHGIKHFNPSAVQ